MASAGTPRYFNKVDTFMVPSSHHINSENYYYHVLHENSQISKGLTTVSSKEITDVDGSTYKRSNC